MERKAKVVKRERDHDRFQILMQRYGHRVIKAKRDEPTKTVIFNDND
jgi:hypothetical protein